MKKFFRGLLIVIFLISLWGNYEFWYKAHIEDSNEANATLALNSATVDKQSEFAYDICKTIIYGNEVLEYKITFGEAERTLYQQRHYLATGRSKTINSNHLRRRALDIHIYDENGTWLRSSKPYRELADYFTSLRDGNVWGGSWRTFKDTPHYERRY